MPVYLKNKPLPLDIVFECKNLYFYYDCNFSKVMEERLLCRCSRCSTINDYYIGVININEAHRILCTYNIVDQEEHLQRMSNIYFPR